MKTFSLANAPHLPVTGESHPLIQESTRWLTTGNAVAVLGALVLFGSWYAWSQMTPEEPPVVQIPGVDFEQFDPAPPPPIVRSTPDVGAKPPVAPKEMAVPEPVNRDDLEDDFTSADDWKKYWDSVPSPGDGDPIVMPPYADAPRDTLIPFDEYPVLLSISAPRYPDLAKAAGIDGTVMVKVFVSRAGKVKDAVAVEGPEVLRNAAVDAAMTALFEPALQGDKPVDVWVMIPVTFSLNR